MKRLSSKSTQKSQVPDRRRLGKVIGYLRVSTNGQALDGESLQRQRERIAEYAKLHDLGPVTFLSDEGHSGFKSNRPAFQELLQLIRKRQVSAVIVFDLSRLSRRVRTTLEFFEEYVDKNRLHFISLREQIETASPSGRAFLAVLSVFSQFVRDQTAHVTQCAIFDKQRDEEFTGGVVPFGYRTHKKGQLVEDPAAKKVIVWMVRQYRKGVGFRRIARDLKIKNIPTKTGKGPWHPKVVRQIILRTERLSSKVAL